MKRFSFTLQSLLNSREALENTAAIKLADAVQALEKARRETMLLTGELKRHIAEMKNLRGTCVPQHKVSTHLKYVERLQHAVADQSRKVAGLEVKMEECRRKLHEAMRERKALERLREIERVRWQDEERRDEQKEMDEYARINHARLREHMADIV